MLRQKVFWKGTGNVLVCGDRNVLVEQEIFWLETGNVPVGADNVRWGAGNDSKYFSKRKEYPVEDRKSF